MISWALKGFGSPITLAVQSVVHAEAQHAPLYTCTALGDNSKIIVSTPESTPPLTATCLLTSLQEP